MHLLKSARRYQLLGKFKEDRTASKVISGYGGDTREISEDIVLQPYT